jgi:uncharacterized protein (TIGR03435 family)
MVTEHTGNNHDNMRCRILCLGAALAGAYARTRPPKLEFEVASIKPVNPNVGHETGVKIYPGGRIIIPTASLKDLIIVAFHLSYWQISGADGWMEKDEYDVQAKPAENLPRRITNRQHSWYSVADPRLREMLQTLLIDRFQLKFHYETKTGRIDLLKRSGKTLRIRPTDPDVVRPNPTGESRLSEVEFTGGRWYLFNASMPQLAKFAADYVLHVPVLDRTGLEGSFDYKQPPPLFEGEAATIDHDESFKQMIPEIGLKLERAEGPVETLVIDHAEKRRAIDRETKLFDLNIGGPLVFLARVVHGLELHFVGARRQLICWHFFSQRNGRTAGLLGHIHTHQSSVLFLFTGFAI